MTGFAIYRGYSGHADREDVNNFLVDLYNALRAKPHEITAEVLLIHPELVGIDLSAYESAYLIENNDLTIQLIFDEDSEPVIRQSASGGGETRTFKEIFRRAVIRIFMREAHRNEYDINVEVF